MPARSRSPGGVMLVCAPRPTASASAIALAVTSGSMRRRRTCVECTLSSRLAWCCLCVDVRAGYVHGTQTQVPQKYVRARGRLIPNVHTAASRNAVGDLNRWVADDDVLTNLVAAGAREHDN